MSCSMGVSLSRRMQATMRDVSMCISPTVRNLVGTSRARNKSSPFFVKDCKETLPSTDAGSFAGLFVNTEASLNQRFFGNGRASHVCHCEATVDSWRVLLIAPFQKQIFRSPTIEGLTVRGAPMTKQELRLQALDRVSQEQTKEDKRE